jgi:alpha-tubulin suppressor-like RCC1 family protein
MKIARVLVLLVGAFLAAACENPSGKEKSSGPSDECEITAFSIVDPEVQGVISGTSIFVDMGVLPEGASRSYLKAAFTVSDGAVARVGESPQTSGMTPQDFTNPVTYVVASENGEETRSYTVTVVSTFSGVSSIAAGRHNSLALKSDGSVWVWGENGSYQVNVTTLPQLHPALMSVLTGVAEVSGGYNHIVARKSDTTVYAWGSNDALQLGRAIGVSKLATPTRIEAFDSANITAIASGYAHNLALDSDGALWAWGGNSYGQLGDASTTDRNIPVQVLTLTDVSSMAGGDQHSAAVKTDGTVWVWGKAGIGSQDGSDNTSPEQATTNGTDPVTGGSEVACGSFHTLLLKTDGTVWAWGDNTYGQLGNGASGAASLFPVQVSGLSGIVAVSAGEYHSIALKNDGTVWAWGYNSNGQLGNGAFGGSSSTAAQVPGLSGIVAVAAGDDFTLAQKSDGTIVGWGDNSYGVLGDGATASRPAPVAVRD